MDGDHVHFDIALSGSVSIDWIRFGDQIDW
jgi:hypothetical protein